VRLSALFSEADLRAISSSVERFRDGSLSAHCGRPERTLSAAELVTLTDEAEQLGLLNSSDELGFGLWEHAEHASDASARALSVQTLRSLATVNAGVAFHLHGLALGRFLCRAVPLRGGARTVVCLQGAWGLGRSALPRLLRGLRLSVEESELLADYFGCDRPRDLLMQAGEPWQHVVLPVFDVDAQTLSFGLYGRAALAPVAVPHSHGLDETTSYAFVRRPHVLAEDYAAPAPEDARELLASALALNALGLLAIGSGALHSGWHKAQTYAGMRSQGGAHIDQHAAVQELLGSARAALLATDTLLESLVLLPPGIANLPRYFAARAEAQPRLCAGANDALQVFGGLGYMCDTGLEKIVRDQNSLRVLYGTPPELRRFLAHWERP
jgi:acyl-CoA dehydrogenase